MCFRMVCAPRFDYGRAEHRIEKRNGEVLFISQGKHTLRLRSSVPAQITEGEAFAEFVLRAGETAAFVLEEARSGEESVSAAPDYAVNSFKETLNFWRHWIGRSTYKGRWRGMLSRSALTLKLLVSQPYGSIVASPTFGLPEQRALEGS